MRHGKQYLATQSILTLLLFCLRLINSIVIRRILWLLIWLSLLSDIIAIICFLFGYVLSFVDILLFLLLVVTKIQHHMSSITPQHDHRQLSRINISLLVRVHALLSLFFLVVIIVIFLIFFDHSWCLVFRIRIFLFLWQFTKIRHFNRARIRMSLKISDCQYLHQPWKRRIFFAQIRIEKFFFHRISDCATHALYSAKILSVTQFTHALQLRTDAFLQCVRIEV
mmetsp:Transcript_39886/g.65368  ORF Transcript_39886/g.65368 Transcript_39886/m.65368 type:complete len:224 (-) Transcript_39886:669-1340(-)